MLADYPIVAARAGELLQDMSGERRLSRDTISESAASDQVTTTACAAGPATAVTAPPAPLPAAPSKPPAAKPTAAAPSAPASLKTHASRDAAPAVASTEHVMPPAEPPAAGRQGNAAAAASAPATVSTSAAASGAAGAAGAAAAAALLLPAEATVHITDKGFKPAALCVAAGRTVCFRISEAGYKDLLEVTREGDRDYLLETRRFTCDKPERLVFREPGTYLVRCGVRGWAKCVLTVENGTWRTAYIVELAGIADNLVACFIAAAV